jgi:hypothetical protein
MRATQRPASPETALGYRAANRREVAPDPAA